MLQAIALLALCAPQDAQPQAASDLVDAHSVHGAVYDVGPRQAAVLMDNPDRIEFPVSFVPGKEHLQAYMHQGMGQLHGFWFLECERTFRQILSEDPDCAMAYWGLAMANVDQPDRAAWFARAAWLKRGLVAKRERLYIDMIARFYSVEGPDEPEGLVEPRNPGPGEDENSRAAKIEKRKKPTKADCAELIKDYEELIWEFPKDIEAKALLANRLWLARRNGLPTTSRMAVESLIREVLAVEPLHPVHHYRIHLWDRSGRTGRVVDSAVKSGPSWPNIAHNWHMGGHIFAPLGRHYDAGWQQEAAARVDHAHMARYWILPDEIHNFAHNNEWLTRSLRHQGRVKESIELAKNMIELPRHPEYNTVDKGRSSSNYGRRRLIETLAAFEQWETLRELGATMYLEPHIKDPEGALRAYSMGRAAAHLRDSGGLADAVLELEAMYGQLRSERSAAIDRAEEEAIAAEEKRDGVRKAMADAMQSFEGRFTSIRRQVDSLQALGDIVNGDEAHAALKALKESRYEGIHLARMMVETGDKMLVKDAIEIARRAARNKDGQLLEHATLAYVLWTAGEKEEALEVFGSLREHAAMADLDMPALHRLSPMAAELDLGPDWAPVFQAAEDVSLRMEVDLESLGPRHWAPPIATDWTLSDAYGTDHSLSDYRGRPVLVVNFLGFGCVHCVEQLQALMPVAGKFRDAGIEMVAIGLQTPEELIDSLSGDPQDTGYPFPVLCDPELHQFKEWRAFDDFEDIALHGTYLIDGAGRVRWLDISHLPFMDVDFLLEESTRLLALPVRGDARTPEVPLTVSHPAPETSPDPTTGANVDEVRGSAIEVEPAVRASALRVSLVLETAPHCQNCIADLRKICSGLDGFVALTATPNETRIEVMLDGTQSGKSDVLAALAAGGRPGREE